MRSPVPDAGVRRNYNKEVMPLPLARQTTICERRDLAYAPVEAPALLRGWHLASFDAPTVAVVWSLSFAWAAGVHLPLWVPVLLALGTWCVYVGDRVLDARRAMRSGALESMRERHFFHWRHRLSLVPLAALGAIAAAGIIFRQMPAAIRAHDSVLALAALAYFSGVHAPGAPGQRWLSRLWPKELVVGVLFTIGCALPTLTRLHGPWRSGMPLLLLGTMSLFAALAWLNCAAIDRWESGEGLRRMLASGLAPGLAPGLIGGGALAMALVSLPFSPRLSLLCAACAASALMLLWLDRQCGRLTPLALRCAADLVLLTPIVCLMR